MATKAKYDAKSIKVLKGLQAVRDRPGMYLGDITNGDALHHLIEETVANSVDEHMAGHCTEIEVCLYQGPHSIEGVMVRDNGRGIPVDMHEEGVSAVEVIMTTLHAGGKFDEKSYQTSAGLHGVGVSAVNAVCCEMSVTVHRDGAEWGMSFEQGRVRSPLKKIKNEKGVHSGTEIHFSFDPEIFSGVLTYDYNRIYKRLQELAFLNSGLTIKFVDSREEKGKTVVFQYEDGAKQFLTELVKRKNALHADPLYFVHQGKKNFVEIAMQWTATQHEDIRCYSNNTYNSEGGTHLTGFRSALTRILNTTAGELGALKGLPEGLTGEDVREGLVAVVSLRISNPSYDAQTKAKLITPDAKALVEDMLKDQFEHYLKNNPGVARRIVERAVLAAKAREAARRAREQVQRKGFMDPLSLPGKLSDCQNKDPKECELLIVEGESAGGSTKGGRDRRFQAVLPLRGKVLNTEDSDAEAIFENKELGTLINAMGCGLQTAGNFDINKLRYHRIIILTDADVDGAHIRTLLLTFFYRHMPRLLWDGHIYIGVPPLFRVKTKNKTMFFNTQVEFDAYIKENGTDLKAGKAMVTRYKGLGEMNSDTLWHTTLDPEHRRLLRVNIDDAIEAEELFKILMGSDVEVRRNFINENALNAKNLDI